MWWQQVKHSIPDVPLISNANSAPPLSSDMHRLSEGQGQKEGHFSAFCFYFGSQEGTLACVFPPKRAVYHVLTSHGGNLVGFATQEGTLACIFQQLGHELWCTTTSETFPGQ